MKHKIHEGMSRCKGKSHEKKKKGRDLGGRDVELRKGFHCIVHVLAVGSSREANAEKGKNIQGKAGLESLGQKRRTVNFRGSDFFRKKGGGRVRKRVG